MTDLDAPSSATGYGMSHAPRCIDLGSVRRPEGTYRIEITGIEAAGEAPWLVVARDPARKTCSETTLAPPEGDRMQVYVTISHAFDRLRLILPPEARLALSVAGQVRRMHWAALLGAAFRRAPRATLAAAGWKLLGKRVRARNRLQRVVGALACFDYGRWLERKAASSSGPTASARSLRTDTIEVVMLSRTGPATTIVPAGADIRATVVLGPGMRLADGALARIAEVVAAHPEAAVIYWDDDIVDADGNRRAPRFKPGWSPDTFLASSYIGAALIRRHALDAIGGLDPHAGAAALDAAILAIAATHPGTAIVRIPDVLSHRHDVGSGEIAMDVLSSRRVRAAHLARHEPDATLHPLGGAHLFRVSRPLPASPPLVSVIVPTRDRLDILAPCLEGVLRRTHYPDIEVVIADNASQEAATRDYLNELARKEPRARVIDVAGPFNFAAINNAAVSAARGDVLCFLNNDIEVLEPDWLAEMVAHALRPGIGAVGAKLLYPGDVVQHGGVILGLNGLAGHAHRFFPARHPGYMDRLRTVQNYAAVTAACLVVQRARFEAVGGFDAARFAVTFNDVDLCLKLLEAGYLNLWTPHATLLHKESASRVHDYAPAQRARFDAECAALKTRWNHLLADDPFYNPNLTRLREDFTVD